jgi:signal transduction histidine kinase
MKNKDAHGVVDYFRQLAESGEARPFDAVLQDMAELFAAESVGVSGIEPAAADAAFGSAKTFPWWGNADLLQRLRASSCAESHCDDSGAWLISLLWEPINGEPQLVWAHRTGKNGWTDADRWSWMFASQALLRRRMPPANASMQNRHRLELAAHVTGRLSHDFGNYLTGILGFTELSLTQAPVDGILHRFLQEVLQSAKHGAEWIRRLHLFCRRNALPSWPTPLKNVLADEEARLRSAGVFNLRWETDVPADLPLVDMDAGELQTVLTELVNNAREACGDQGTITFTARVSNLTEAGCRELLGAARPGPHVELTVTDDGPGIAPEDRAKLGHVLFYSTKPRHRGLGVLVVYGGMQRCHGGYRVGTPVAKGAVMQLYLPVAALPISTPADADAAELLLVNANPTFFESMRKILESRGYRTTVATSAPAALTAFTAPRQSFALVVIDAALPQASGFDLARRMLDHDPKANFLFLHTASSFHGLGEEELVKRFPLLRWPLLPQTFLQAIQTAQARGKG